MRKTRIARSQSTTSSTRNSTGLTQADCTVRCKKPAFDAAIANHLRAALTGSLDFNPLVKFYWREQFGVKCISRRRAKRRQDQIGHVGQTLGLSVLGQQVAAENHAQGRAVGLVEV